MRSFVPTPTADQPGTLINCRPMTIDSSMRSGRTARSGPPTDDLVYADRETPWFRDLSRLCQHRGEHGRCQCSPGTRSTMSVIVGADLFYPAVTLDASGDVITVFDEFVEHWTADRSWPRRSTAAPRRSQTSQTLRQSADLSTTATFVLQPVTSGCRWGDYSGAARIRAIRMTYGLSPRLPEDGLDEGPCNSFDTHFCWNTTSVTHARRPDDLVLTPAVRARRRGADRDGGRVRLRARHHCHVRRCADRYSSNPHPESFTLVTPPGRALGGSVFVVATDSLGSSLSNGASRTRTSGSRTTCRSSRSGFSTRGRDVYPMHGWARSDREPSARFR